MTAMPTTESSVLAQLCARFPTRQAFMQLARSRHAGANPAQILIDYRDALDWLEPRVWAADAEADLLAQYQGLYREFEQLRDAMEDDRRHHFVVVIPVADRPEHLHSCLSSLLELCRLYRYGGLHDGRYTHVAVLVADDSEADVNCARHREIAAVFHAEGLTTEYFGAEAQRELYARLSASTRRGVVSLLGSGDRLHHKGASITRNLAYLHLATTYGTRPRQLFYFVDSDHEFRVRVDGPQGQHSPFALNYLHHLDRLFSDPEIQVLTGKVVGDPPVSPAVMASNFLEDVLCFLSRMAQVDAASACTFHQTDGHKVTDASYHDMADLFGFRPAVESYNYHCTLEGAHDHTRCLGDFAARLNRFFDGEHPTRRSFYEHADLRAGIGPARTIYTGNYILRPVALRYPIPFANLKLRMAGPVLGRLIKAEIGSRFVSANLPMLHKRTVRTLGQAEFRPGIEHADDRIDLCGEFERQFFGDVMLFTIERLTALGYPTTPLSDDVLEQTLHATEQHMLTLYSAKHAQILDKLDLLDTLYGDRNQWWHADRQLAGTCAEFTRFIANMRHNFGAGSCGYAAIAAPENRTRRHAQLLTALVHLAEDQAAWQQLLQGQHPPVPESIPP